MALVREFVDDEHLPEYGTLMLRDGRNGPPPDFSTPVPPRDYPADAQPCGTIGRAGAGFLEGAASDWYQVVRLELHDGPPPDDRADWSAILQTPLLTRTGLVGLTYVTGGTPEAGLLLGDPGRYAVRVARRGEHPDFEWLLSFWPDPDGAVDIPQWIKRSRPATEPGRDGWSTVLGHRAYELAGIVRATTRDLSIVDASQAQVDAWGLAHARRPGWLDAPLFAAPAMAPPTGHADLDDRAEAMRLDRQAELAREADALAEIATQLAVAPPAVVRDLFGLLTAAGVLVVGEAGAESRYRLGQPRPAVDVVRLPSALVRQLHDQDARHRYTSFATDLVSIAVWAPESPVVSTVDDLGSRLLAAPDEVRATLAWAAEVGQLTVEDGDLVRFGVGSGRPRAGTSTQPAGPGLDPRQAMLAHRQAMLVDPPSRRRAPAATPATLSRRATAASGPRDAPAVVGAPPRAGYVTSTGDLVVWRDGEPVILSRGDGGLPFRALQTAYGVAVFGTDGARHIRRDGTVEQLGEVLVFRGVTSEDGRQLAFAEGTTGRRARHTVHLVDLADGSRQSLRWPDDDTPSVAALHAGVVYIGAIAGLTRWVPGADPEPLPYQLRGIDPLTGTLLTVESKPEFTLTRADGTTTRIAVDLSAMLAPGGTRLYTLRHSPPAVTLFHVDGGESEPVVHWLPACDTNVATPGRPCWEDADHLLFMSTDPRRRAIAPALRVDVTTGAIEGVPLIAESANRAGFVEPLLWPDVT